MIRLFNNLLWQNIKNNLQNFSLTFDNKITLKLIYYTHPLYCHSIIPIHYTVILLYPYTILSFCYTHTLYCHSIIPTHYIVILLYPHTILSFYYTHTLYCYSIVPTHYTVILLYPYTLLSFYYACNTILFTYTKYTVILFHLHHIYFNSILSELHTL